MNKLWSDKAWEDYLFWQVTDRCKVKKINELIKEAERAPFEGKVKPEPLRHEFSGWWSRRIDREHRLVYRVTGNPPHTIEIAACRLHYA